MSARTLRTKQITVKISEPLHKELEREAAEEYRSVGSVVRRALINHALDRSFGAPAGEHSQWRNT